MDNTTDDSVLDTDQTTEEVLSTEEGAEHTESGEGNDDSEELSRLRSENAKLVEIIKRRKARDATSTQDTPPEKKDINKNSSQLSRDEAILIAQGFSEEDLEQLNLVAKGAGISLREAKEHPLFTAYADAQETAKKAKKATMGTSKGSATKKTADIGAMSEEDHKKAWLDKIGMSE